MRLHAKRHGVYLTCAAFLTLHVWLQYSGLGRNLTAAERQRQRDNGLQEDSGDSPKTAQREEDAEGGAWPTKDKLGGHHNSWLGQHDKVHTANPGGNHLPIGGDTRLVFFSGNHSMVTQQYVKKGSSFVAQDRSDLWHPVQNDPELQLPPVTPRKVYHVDSSPASRLQTPGRKSGEGSRHVANQPPSMYTTSTTYLASARDGRDASDGGLAAAGGTTHLSRGPQDDAKRPDNQGARESVGQTPPHGIQHYLFNCSNVADIVIKHKLGHGVSKHVYLGHYGAGRVAVKMVTRNVLDVTSCVSRLPLDGDPRLRVKDQCYVLPNMKLMKEILLLQQLHHPNLMQLLGFCVRSEETESTSLQEHGVLEIMEYGLRFYLSSLAAWPLRKRLETTWALADLLDYLEHSPLGSLRISDFKEEHFLLVDDMIKLTDLDDVTSLEPSCSPTVASGAGVPARKLRSRRAAASPGSVRSQYNPPPSTAARRGSQPPSTAVRPAPSGNCKYGLLCQGGICTGHNAKQNMDNMNKLFFRILLQPEDSEKFRQDGDGMEGVYIESGRATGIPTTLYRLRKMIANLDATAKEVKVMLSDMLRRPDLL